MLETSKLDCKAHVDIEHLWSTVPDDSPVLFWDTCGLLDCLRIVKRYDINYFVNYNFVLNKVVDGKLISVISDMVYQEIMQNWDEVYDEATKFQRDTRLAIKKIMRICGLPKAEIETISQTIENVDAVGKSKKIIEDILQNSYVVDNNPIFQNFAHLRVMGKIAPAHVKQEYKDCYIWGCVTNCANSRPAKSRKVYYISSNTEDYSDAQTKMLAPQIVSDCESCGIEFATNIGMLRGLL